LLKNDPKAQENQTAAAFGNLMSSVGNIITPLATGVMRGLTIGLTETRSFWDDPKGFLSSAVTSRPAGTGKPAAFNLDLDAPGRWLGSFFSGGGAKALGAALPPPQVTTDTKVDVKVLLDSSEIAAKVEQKVTNQNRAVNGSADMNSGKFMLPPDAGN